MVALPVAGAGQQARVGQGLPNFSEVEYCALPQLKFKYWITSLRKQSMKSDGCNILSDSLQKPFQSLLIVINFSEAEYCALPQLRFKFKFQVKVQVQLLILNLNIYTNSTTNPIQPNHLYTNFFKSISLPNIKIMTRNFQDVILGVLGLTGHNPSLT